MTTNPGVVPTLSAVMACIFMAFSPGVRPGYDSGENPPITASKKSPQVAPSKVAESGTNDARSISRIAFASDRDGNLEVYAMDVDGGAQIRLTENTGEDYSPAWSPDGSRLAFVSTRDGNAEVYVMNADGTAQTRLTDNSAADLGPKWSPDGTQILFFTNRNGNDEIYAMNPDGSSQTNLTNHPADDTSFSFSPNGALIAFSSNREDSQFDIYIMNSKGGAATRLTTSVGDDIDPAWSSLRIAFSSNRDDTDEIYSMGTGGQNQTRLTNNAEFDIDPSQPADGSRISFATSRDGNLEIYLMNGDGSGLVRLTTNEASDVQPALQSQAVIPPAAGASTVQFSSTSYSVDEGAAFATLTVTRTGDVTGTSLVDFSTVNGSATNRSDYTDHYGTLSFNPGETSKTFIVLITDDVFIEPNESLTVTLSNPVGSVFGSLTTTTLTILDNDTSLFIPNPIDNARFFVTQHYADFLNRAPDPAGLEGWINQINSCGNNLTCVEQRRIQVSSGFFRSPEFQDRGYFVYRFYPVSFGRPPTYAEFIPDMSRVSGFLTAQQLEAAKVALINDFVSRPAFVNKYNGLSNAAYVDTLLATAGVALPNRQSLINSLDAGTKTRAQVLREIVESVEVYQRYFNQAFVVMSYFGYLRRDPDILYLEWIRILDSTGDFQIMINGFMNSIEYRSRFGP
ncbi:MAG TPA: Calx-beta domain-containing protein [Pyrinomonadaceae bacterium]|nr:Calx-beta domain-containing protein [Pyrinomonadaceae bacterium]